MVELRDFCGGTDRLVSLAGFGGGKGVLEGRGVGEFAGPGLIEAVWSEYARGVQVALPW